MPHPYLGSDHRLYLDYADAATGRTLEVAPGGTYDVRAREPGMPVPPPDGRWGPAPEPALTALVTEPAEAAASGPEPEDPEPAPPQTSALPALPGTGDGGQPATNTKE